MKVAFKYMSFATSALLALLFLLSTSGFSIYQHSCTNSNYENYSIIIPADECNHSDNSNEVTSCCKIVEQTTCCSKDEGNTSQESECCNNKKEFKKLNIDLLSYSKLLLNKNTLIEKQISSTLSTLIYKNKQDSNFIHFYDNSPPLAPHVLRALIQCFII